jgi:ABC-type molybdate transport system permease subunit
MPPHTALSMSAIALRRSNQRCHLAIFPAPICAGSLRDQIENRGCKREFIVAQSPRRAFFTVTLPQIRFSVVTSALFAFYVSFDEVIIAMFISTGTGGALNRKMFNALRDQVDPTIAAISTCLVAISITLLVLAQVFKPNADER